MSDATWLVDGVDLATSFDLLVRGTTWRSPISARIAQVEVPGRHGSVVSPRIATMEPATVTLTIDTAVADAQELDEVTNYLQSILARPLGVTLTRTVNLRAGGTRSASAKAWLMSLTHTDPQGIGLLVTWTAVLTVPGVFFRGNNAIITYSLGVDDGTVTVTGLAGSTAPIADVEIRITGPATSASVIDPETGTGISWAGTIEADQYLFIRADEARAYMGGGGSWGNATASNRSSEIDYPSAGLLQLWPRVVGSSTVVEMAVAIGGRGVGTDLAIRARPAYL